MAASGGATGALGDGAPRGATGRSVIIGLGAAGLGAERGAAPAAAAACAAAALCIEAATSAGVGARGLALGPPGIAWVSLSVNANRYNTHLNVLVLGLANSRLATQPLCHLLRCPPAKQSLGGCRLPALLVAHAGAKKAW